MPKQFCTKFKPIKRLRLLSKSAETGEKKSSPVGLGGYLLRYAAITAFVGAGLQALFGDFPLRALLWDQSWWNGCAELLGFSWTEWVTSLNVDQTIDGAGKVLGGLLVLFGGVLALLRTGNTGIWTRIILIGGFCILLLRNFLFWKEHFWQVGQLLEMFVLMGAPLLYLGYLNRIESTKKTKRLLPQKSPAFETLRDNLASEPPSVTPPTPGNQISHIAYRISHIFWPIMLRLSPGTPRAAAQRKGPGERENQEHPVVWLRVLIALTFTGHGLYAAGFHPVPANFVFMTQAGLGVGEDVARQLLFVVGMLDFLAAALLLIPWRRAWLAGLTWIIPWAVLTSFARVWSYSGFVELETMIYQWTPEVVVRLPHILLPLALFFLARTQGAEMVEPSNGLTT